MGRFEFDPIEVTDSLCFKELRATRDGDP